MFQAIVGIGALAHNAAPRVDDDSANARIWGRLSRARASQIKRAAQELLVGDVIRQVCKKNKMTMEAQSHREITWKTFSPCLCASVVKDIYSNSESTNSFGSRGSRSPTFSPTATNLTGSPRSREISAPTPPFPVPSASMRTI